MAQFAATDLRFRQATEGDLDRILEIDLVAYPDPGTPEERRRNFTASPWGDLSDVYVAEKNGVVVGQAFLFPLSGWFGGREVRIGGIASVAVAPEVRGRGVATALMAHLHVRADRRGDALTMLYPFQQGFYARLDYATTSSRRRLLLEPGSIPRAWRGDVRTPHGDDAEILQRLYARAGARSSGWLARPVPRWNALFARERRHHLLADGGYVAFEVEQPEAHARTTLYVKELVAEDEAARRVLFGALGAMRDQVDEIQIEVADDDPIELALLDADRRRRGTDRIEHSCGAIVLGPMVRVEDVPRAIEARGYAEDATFDVVIEGEGEIAVSVRVEGGHAEVGAARGGPAVRTDRRGLGALLYGGIRPSAGARIGLCDADRRTLARVDAALAIPPLLPVDPF